MALIYIMLFVACRKAYICAIMLLMAMLPYVTEKTPAAKTVSRANKLLIAARKVWARAAGRVRPQATSQPTPRVYWIRGSGWYPVASDRIIEAPLAMREYLEEQNRRIQALRVLASRR